MGYKLLEKPNVGLLVCHIAYKVWEYHWINPCLKSPIWDRMGVFY